MKRRSFFGAVAAAGIGGKRVATDVLSGMEQVGLNPMPPGTGRGATALGGSTPDYIAHLQGEVAKRAALRATGLSPLVREIFRGWRSPGEANLDDINSLVSVSVSAKKRMIREKMEEARINEWFDQPARNLKREMLNKEFGVNL